MLWPNLFHPSQAQPLQPRGRVFVRVHGHDLTEVYPVIISLGVEFVFDGLCQRVRRQLVAVQRPALVVHRMRQRNYRVDRGGSLDYRRAAAQAVGVSSASR